MSGMFANAGFPTDQVTVLNAVVALLQASVVMLSGNNTCFLSMHTDPIESQRQNLYASVAPMSGQYDEGIFAGAARISGQSSGVLEQTGVIVTVFSQMRLDRPDADSKMLTDETRGLLALKRQILSALSGRQLQDADGNNILTTVMRPINASHPGRAAEETGAFSVAFSTDFVWDLSSEDDQ